MNYLKTYLFKISLLALLIIFAINLFAAEREDLYQVGRIAYNQGDYVKALKNLYAFYVMNEDAINKNPEFKMTLENKILHCETILEVYYITNISITPNDSMTRFKINKYRATGGKAFTIDDLVTNKVDLLEIKKEIIQETQLQSPIE